MTNLGILREFSKINRERSDRWHPDGIESWSLSDWGVALAGECGELCNVIKKLNRSRDGLVGNSDSDYKLQLQLGDEIADVFCYLDLLAQRAGLSLGECVRIKFNAVSARNGFPERIGESIESPGQ